MSNPTSTTLAETPMTRTALAGLAVVALALVGAWSVVYTKGHEAETATATTPVAGARNGTSPFRPIEVRDFQVDPMGYGTFVLDRKPSDDWHKAVHLYIDELADLPDGWCKSVCVFRVAKNLVVGGLPDDTHDAEKLLLEVRQAIHHANSPSNWVAHRDDAARLRNAVLDQIGAVDRTDE